MNRTKNNPNIWTEKRRALCDEFWGDCAQCECEAPCKRILKAEGMKFKKGDYVFHECDAKKPHMLMIVDLIDECNGLIETHYIDKKFAGRKWHGYESEIRLNSEVGEMPLNLESTKAPKENR